MSAVWLTIAGLALGTILIKAVGPLVLGERELPERGVAVITLVAPALLAALVAYETFSAEGPALTVDARLAGLVAAAGGLALKLPLVVVVALAATTAALVRLVA